MSEFLLLCNFFVGLIILIVELGIISDLQSIRADLYVQGHTHRLMFWSNLKRFPTGYKRIYYAQSGHFLDYKGYPDQQYLQLEPLSWQLITINQNRLVKCHQYFAEID